MTRPPLTTAAARSARRTGRRRSHPQAGGRAPRPGSPAAAAILVALGVVVLPAGCRPRGVEKAVTPSPQRPLTAVLADHTPDLMRLPGVVGTAQSQLDDGRPCILVMVVRLTRELRRRIPETIEGWPVRVQETGEIRALPDSGP